MKDILPRKTMTEKEENNWMTLCHLGGIISAYYLNLIIPIAIWFTQKPKSDYIGDQGKEIINFQVSITIYSIGLYLLSFTIIGIPIIFIGSLVLMVGNFILCVKGAIKASRGEVFNYPFNLRLLK